MQDSYYHSAQICANGHVINTYADSSPQRNQKHCAECGAVTTTTCGSCGSTIRGHYEVPGVIDLTGHYSRPSYCHDCGEPYPWTLASIDAARELADEILELSPEERSQLKDSFPDLLRSTPKTALAETRFKKLMKKAGSEAYGAMKSILVDVVTEAVKKSVFGS